MRPAVVRGLGFNRLAALVALPLAVSLWGAGGCSTDGPAVDPDAPLDMAAPAPDLAKDGRLDPDEIPLKVSKRCPGDPECADSGDQVLYAGAAVRDVTPEIEPFEDKNKNFLREDDEPYTDVNGNGKFDAYWMAGFGRGRLATGVHDKTWARALALRQNQTTVVLVAVDALGLFRDESVEVEKLLDKRLGIDLLLVHATHLHETNDVVGGWGETLASNGIHPDYQKRLRRLIAEAATEAVQSLKPARLTLGSIPVADGPNNDMHRYVNDVRDPVVIDNRLHTLQLSDITSPMSPKPIATVINWAHHPESISDKNHEISSDFVGYLRDEVEKAGGGTAIYVSGALGGQIGPSGVVPLDDKGMEVRSAGFAKAEAIGKSVARFALTAMADPKALTVAGKDARLGFRSTTFPVRVDNTVYHLAFMLGVYKREMCCYDDKRPIDETNVPSTPSAATYLTLGPASILTNPGELLPELFLGGYGGEYAGTYKFIDMTQKNPPDVSKAPKPPYLVDIMDGPREHRMTFGLTQDFLGYIVPRYNFVLSESSPYFSEADGDHYEETNSIGPYAEPQIVGTLRQLVLDGRPNVAR